MKSKINKKNVYTYLKHFIFKSIFLFITLYSSFLILPVYVHAAGLISPPSNLGLGAYFTFDEGTSTQLYNHSTSDTQIEGTLSNFGPNPWISGKLRKALLFDGINDVVTLTSNSISTRNTFSSWIKVSSVPATGNIFAARNVGTNDPNFQVSLTSTAVRFTIGFSGAQTGQWEVSNTGIVDNQWHHVLITYNGSATANDPVFYIDGVARTLSSDSNPASGTILTTATPWTIGNNSNNTAPFTGAIDDMRLYGRVLTASEAFTVYKTKSAGVSISNTANGVRRGLVGHWTFDGDKTNWLVGTTQDSSGNGNSGNFVNLATTTAPQQGKIGQALNFRNATGGNFQYVDVPNPTVLDSLTSVTVCGWVKPGGNGGNGAIVSRQNWEIYLISRSDGASDLAIYEASGPGGSTVGFPIPGSTWSHVCAVEPSRSSGPGFLFYVDGTVVSSNGSGSGAPFSDVGTPLRIGAYSNNTENYIGGIDDVRIYNRALSASEIKQLYQSSSQKIGVNSTNQTNSISGLVGYWNFDGNTIDWTTNLMSDLSGKAAVLGWNTLSTTTTPRPGKVGQAFLFKGNDTGTNQLIGNITGANTSNLTALTICAWVNPVEQLASFPEIVIKTLGSYAWDLYLVNFGGGTAPFGFGTSAVGGAFAEANAAAIPDRQWSHICGVQPDASGANFKLYLNGALVASTNGGTATRPNDTGYFLLVGAVGASNQQYNGLLDEVRLYNKALSATEIYKLYNQAR